MGNGISISLADVSYRVENKRILYDWINRCVRSEGRTITELSIIICSDEFLLNINKKFLEHNYYTDIITFDYTEGKLISGELYISIDRVRDNANMFSTGVKDELHRVMIHGILHLCGYKDKSKRDIKLMRNKEEQKLKLLTL